MKEGVEMLPHAVYRLDRYHLRRALVEGLGGDSQGYERVAQAIAEGDWEKAQTGLREARERAPRDRRKRIWALERYLKNNWAGIVKLPEAKLPEAWRLGAMERQVFHHVARRMKRHGARWSVRGADHLACLLAVKASGEWDRFMSRRGRTVSRELERRVTRRWGRQMARAAGEWLQTHLPALEGPAADRPWVKHMCCGSWLERSNSCGEENRCW
ncbi:UPF0236 family transposase-like protein [Hydrogenibacillus sp. N12]|uniref:UPF0236 family transposase-like protein n=1 Tax=Hydrogenibacillus sp. N12 TaxID=2866627 RepID=UPI001C7CB622|nr:UPF0236 family protein [Hydrogenibacillus sp. N12]